MWLKRGKTIKKGRLTPPTSTGLSQITAHRWAAGWGRAQLSTHTLQSKQAGLTRPGWTWVRNQGHYPGPRHPVGTIWHLKLLWWQSSSFLSPNSWPFLHSSRSVPVAIRLKTARPSGYAGHTISWCLSSDAALESPKRGAAGKVVGGHGWWRTG